MADCDSAQWALVLAGISDFWRPAENLSLTQNLALTATGMIWTRWCFVIKPKNMLYVISVFPSSTRCSLLFMINSLYISAFNSTQKYIPILFHHIMSFAFYFLSSETNPPFFFSPGRRLAAVNFFLACVGITQLSRIFLYQRSVKNSDSTAVIKEDARDLKDSAAAVVGETKAAVREAID